MRMGIWEILIIVLLIVILFGHNKIPGMMKNLANGLNIFKKELKAEREKKYKSDGMSNEEAKEKAKKDVEQMEQSYKDITYKATAEQQAQG